MNKIELTQELKEIRSKVTKLGYNYVSSLMPISLADAASELRPIVRIENALTESMEELGYVDKND